MHRDHRERVVNSAPEPGRAGSVCIPAPRAERKPYQTFRMEKPAAAEL
jgi:hypothetical protein